MVDTSILRQVWDGSRLYRRLLIAVAVYAVLRLLMQVALAMSDDFFPDDLRIYLDAARDIRHGRDLYPPLPLERMEFFQYAPSFALAFVPFLALPKTVAALIHTLLHVILYAYLYVSWDRLFTYLKLDGARVALARTLPVWLLFSAFWGDLAFLNIYLILALLATLLLEAILKERLGWALLWLSLILQAKPQWAFAVLVPLLLGHYRFFIKLVVGAVIAYAVIAGVTMLAVGPSYGWEQHRAYVHLLSGISEHFPWRGPGDDFLGYNHSIKQIVFYLFGINSTAETIALVIKTLALVPLAALGLRCLTHPPRRSPDFVLDLFFALYTAAFIWLDVVWELSLGIALFPYLLATLSSRRARIAVWAVFLPYALVDVMQIVGYAAFGDAVLVQDSYILTDLSIYLPLVMIVTVLFHGLLVGRLWHALAHQPERVQVQPAAGEA